MAQVVLMLLFSEKGSSHGRELPEEGIIHFQECLNQRELLESSSVLGVSPGLLCPLGLRNPLASALGATRAAPGWADPRSSTETARVGRRVQTPPVQGWALPQQALFEPVVFP